MKEEIDLDGCRGCLMPGTSAQEISLCRICTTQWNNNEIIKIRTSAQLYLENEALKMKASSKLKFPLFSVHTVRLQIPDVDRGKRDFRNVFITVIEITDNGLYKLGNKRETMEEIFSSERKNLQELANKQSLSGG